MTRTAEVMTALEGFLIQTHQKNADAKWDFREMKRELLADVRRVGTEDSLVAEYVAVARSNAGAVRPRARTCLHLLATFQ